MSLNRAIVARGRRGWITGLSPPHLLVGLSQMYSIRVPLRAAAGLACHVGERPWWLKKSPKKRGKRKAKRRAFGMMGDSDINFIDFDDYAPNNDFTDVMFSHHLQQSVLRPTRITDLISKLIVNVDVDVFSAQSSQHPLSTANHLDRQPTSSIHFFLFPNHLRLPAPD